MKQKTNWLRFSSKRHDLIEAWLMVLFSIIVFSVIIWFGIKQKNYEYLTAILLAITLLAIFWNTVASWNLKRLTSKQISFSIRPVVICEISGHVCHVINAGRGAALYIESDKIPINIDASQYKSFQIPDKAKYIYFGKLTCVEPISPQKGLRVCLLDEKGKNIAAIGPAIDRIINSLNEITLYYKDTEGTKYKTLMKKENDTFKMVSIK